MKVIRKVHKGNKVFKFSEEKSVSAWSLFHTLMTRSQKKVVPNISAIWFLEQLVYLWPLVCVTVENSSVTRHALRCSSRRVTSRRRASSSERRMRRNWRSLWKHWYWKRAGQDRRQTAAERWSHARVCAWFDSCCGGDPQPFISVFIVGLLYLIGYET